MPGAASTSIPASRYSERQFVFVEDEHVWRKAWLLVGSTDHVARPGDFVETRFGQAPTFVVRGAEGRLRGFVNICPHQGAPLCLGAGAGLEQIQCNNHQWTWDLAGRLEAVDFGAPVPPGQEIPLQPLVVETWGPLVFATFDLGAPALADAMATLQATITDAGLDPAQLRCRSTVSLTVGGNWKSLVDGTTAVGPVPDLGVRVPPGLAVSASDAGVTIVRARPFVSIDRAYFDVLVFEPRPAGEDPGDHRPLDVTLKGDAELPPDTGVDPELIAFARRQIGTTPPTEDLEVDDDAAPELVALHAWLDARLPAGA